MGERTGAATTPVGGSVGRNADDAYDPEQKPIGLGEKLTRMMPASKDALPAGDFRDWQRIDAWAKDIAEQVSRS